MIKCIQYRGAIGALNMHTQMGWAFVDKVTPSLTNMRELAPPQSDIPIIGLIHSIAVEYAEEYIVVEPMNSHICVGIVRRWRW